MESANLDRTVRLIHWNRAEAVQKAECLRRLGYQVLDDLPQGQDFLVRLRQDPPMAVIIDLSRVPSHGRDWGVALRQTGYTRYIPLVFVDGDPQKVEAVRQLLPDATYTSWEQIGEALLEAINNRPKNPVAPSSRLAGYAGRPLVKKLGIMAGMHVILVDPPQGFIPLLEDNPTNVNFLNLKGNFLSPETSHVTGGVKPGLVIWFVRSLLELNGRVEKVFGLAGNAPVWIAWIKKASGMSSDVNVTHVRRVGLAAGRVDYKISSLDATWSGLLFARRDQRKSKG